MCSPLLPQLLRAIDKGLAKSRAGIVLVTPPLLERLASEGIADKELSELLSRDQLIPVVHETTFEALREVSPPARFAKRLGHRRRLDGGHHSQDRRAGHRVGTATWSPTSAASILSLRGMWIPKTAEEVEVAARAGELAETPSFDAKAALPAPKKNASLAIDVAAMSTDGGVLVYGIAEDDDGRPTIPTPIELAGAGQRIDQIVATSLSEVPFVKVEELPLKSDPAKGYLVVVILQSERAPHQVTVGQEFRFYSRGPKGNRILAEGEVARLYRRREEWTQDRMALLETAIRHAEIPEGADPGHLHGFTRPVSDDPELSSGRLRRLEGHAPFIRS